MLRRIKESKLARWAWSTVLSCITLISPKLNTKLYYYISHGKKLELKNPKGFNEKILWLKLNRYNKDELVRKCSDKYTVRSFVKARGCGSTLNPLLKVYDLADAIQTDDLPDRFALKVNYGCAYNIICDDKTHFDLDKAKKKLNRWMRSHYYLAHSEMQYKGVEHKILLEQFIENKDGGFPDDYKFYCFDGEPMYLLYCTDRNVDHAQKTFYDIDGNIAPLRVDCTDRPFDKPGSYEEMLDVCRKLSKGFPFVRVDLYDCDGKVIFGELTFTPAGGTGQYTQEGDKLLGGLILV